MWTKIVVLSAVYGIYKIAKEILGNRRHLTDQEIRKYKHHRRSLSSAEQRRVTNHIGTCDDCRTRFTDVLMGEGE